MTLYTIILRFYIAINLAAKMYYFFLVFYSVLFREHVSAVHQFSGKENQNSSLFSVRKVVLESRFHFNENCG